MDRKAFETDRATLLYKRGEDTSGMLFWGFALMMYERIDVMRILKKAAKEAFIEATGKDDHWANHKFMMRFGQKARSGIIERDQVAERRAKKSRR